MYRFPRSAPPPAIPRPLAIPKPPRPMRTVAPPPINPMRRSCVFCGRVRRLFGIAP
jgi:hypothetical protein